MADKNKFVVLADRYADLTELTTPTVNELISKLVISLSISCILFRGQKEEWLVFCGEPHIQCILTATTTDQNRRRK